MGDLDRLQAEVNADLLDAWIKVYAKAEAIYNGLPDDEKRWIEDHGHEVESLVSVIVTMKPHVRTLCRSLVEQGRRASLSQRADTVEGAVEDVTARAKSGGEKMGGDVDVVAESVEERLTRLEAMAEENAQLIRRILERLDGAGSRATPRAET